MSYCDYYLVDPRVETRLTHHFRDRCAVVKWERDPGARDMTLAYPSSRVKKSFDVWYSRYLIPLESVYFEHNSFTGERQLFRATKFDDDGFVPITFYRDKRQHLHSQLRWSWLALSAVRACWIEGVRHEF